MERRIDRIGEINTNKLGSTIQIVEYNNVHNIKVKFIGEEHNGYEVKSAYKLFKNGNIASPYERRTLNIGYIGEGDYKVSENGKLTKAYVAWKNMIARSRGSKNPTYKNYIISEEWYNFQNFAKFFYENKEVA